MKTCEQLVADSLHCEPERAEPLAELIRRQDYRQSIFRYSVLFCACRRVLAHLRLWRRAMVLGPESHSRQGLYRQCRGPYGGEVESPAHRDTEGITAACVPREQRRLRNATHGLPGLERGNARTALGSGPNGPHFPIRRFLQVPPRSCAGSSVLSDPSRIAGRGASPNRHVDGITHISRQT